MNKAPDDAARLIREILTQLGWEANPETVAAQVAGLNRGLPLEDEFSVLCSWLGNCELVHKLAHSETPPDSSGKYLVPDLLVAFRVQGRIIPVLVEVKSKQEKVLSFRPDYVSRLMKYSDLTGLPLLIAWKHQGLWALFEVNKLQKASKNLNITFSSAMTYSLLGVLAGDFMYSLHPRAGIHLSFRKQDLVHIEATPDGFSEQWNAICDDVYFTGKDGRKFDDISPSMQSLFLAWNLEETENHSQTHIEVSYVTSDSGETGLFAHNALVRLLTFSLPEDSHIDWRSLLVQSPMLQGGKRFFAAVREALDLEIVHSILLPVPRVYPAFVPKV